MHSRLRLGIYIVVAAVIAAAVGYGASRLETKNVASPRTTATSTTSTSFPTSSPPTTSAVQFSQLAVYKGHLVATAPGASYNCAAVAPINLTTLAIETNDSHQCVTDPSLTYAGPGPYRAGTVGESVSPVVSCNQKMTDDSGTVQIKVTNPASGTPTLGPIVMSYSCAINTYVLEDAYGAGILWLYDCETTSGPQLVEVSAVTGAVEAKVSMPDICQADISADAEGFFLAQNDLRYGPKSIPIYHVAPGASQATGFGSFSNGLIWDAMIGSSYWAEMSNRVDACGQQTLCQFGELVRYVGPAATPQVVASDLETGYQAPPVPGDGSYWAVTATPSMNKPTTYAQGIVRIDVATGQVTEVGSFGPSMLAPGAGASSIAYFDGAVYVLEGTTVYRVVTRASNSLPQHIKHK